MFTGISRIGILSHISPLEHCVLMKNKDLIITLDKIIFIFNRKNNETHVGGMILKDGESSRDPFEEDLWSLITGSPRIRL